MNLASLCQHYLPRFKSQYAKTTNADQWSALNAILGCRTNQYGQIVFACDDCSQHSSRYQSCGHRACNQCQNHCTTQWLERQTQKLLPVEYFMVTFTLPYELRAVAKSNQKLVYSLLFQCAVSTLKDFGLNEKGFAAQLAMTAVLHTHTRRLDYHPHIHMIVPGGGINEQRNEWRTTKGQYLFNGRKLAAVFRGRMLAALQLAALKIPKTPRAWVAQCQRVGKGLPALKYLSRYLYRGVISNDNIINDDGTYVTFRYKDSSTGKVAVRRERGEVFMALVLQHTLPKGFRRARDYGFLHGNAKRILKIVQWVLQVVVPKQETTQRPKLTCRHCHASMSVIGFKRPSYNTG
tara:strand:+ start:251 stop:1297 length:1047 start_codon:yes stop_codon:yes gene_type:complete